MPIQLGRETNLSRSHNFRRTILAGRTRLSCEMTGWLVIVLKRHTEALHELTPEEFAELAQIQARLIHLLYEELHCEKEYVSCYAEKEHFQHIHFHVFAKPPGLPEELKGGGSFALLKVILEEAVPPDEIISFCKLLKDKFAYTPSL